LSRLDKLTVTVLFPHRRGGGRYLVREK